MARKPDPFMIDDENPELTDEQLAKLRPARDVLPSELYAALIANQRSVAVPRRSASKVAVTLRLDRTVVDHFKAGGVGWQKRINAALKKIAAG